VVEITAYCRQSVECPVIGVNQVVAPQTDIVKVDASYMSVISSADTATTHPQPDLYISGGPRLDSYGGPKALPTFRSPIVYN